MRVGLFGLVLQGCFVVTVPGRAPTGTFSPLPEGDDTTGSVYLEGAFWPIAGANLQLPSGEAHVIELGGQVAATHWAASPGLWFRGDTPGDDKKLAHRLGLEFGQGDVVGFRAWEMPFMGLSYHFQSQRAHPRHVSSFTLGVQATTPLDLDEVEYTDDDGESFAVVSLPAGWFGARWAWAWPVASSGDRFVLAAGFDMELGLVGISLLVTPLLPSPTLSLAWQFGPPA